VQPSIFHDRGITSTCNPKPLNRAISEGQERGQAPPRLGLAVANAAWRRKSVARRAIRDHKI